MASLLEAVTVSNPDEIYNLAAQSFVGASFDQPLLTTEIDASGSTRFLEIIRHLNKNIKYYQASTSELYGGSKECPQDERTPMIPNSPYAAAKLHSFHMNKIYRHSYGIFASNGILFNHECVSENTPLILRDKKTKVIFICRVKDFRRAREKGSTIQQWPIEKTEIWDGKSFVDLLIITATKRKKDKEDFHCKIINTRLGVIETTNHHHLFLDDASKIKAKDVSLGRKLLHQEFPLETCFSCVSKEEAIFLGMMAGDGHISEEGKAKFTNNDPEVTDLLKNLWRKVNLGTITMRSYKTEYGKATQAGLTGNREYLRFLRKELYTYDGFKKVPTRIINSDKETKLAFLTGYNLTDGLKSNPCTYEFKNFKTNSILLAQGLLLLISQTTKQRWNITFEYDEEYYGYYSINLLSPTNKKNKEEIVQQLLRSGMSQRAISRDTGISRTFIRKITKGGKAEQIHHLSKPGEEVKKVLYHRQQPEWTYDLETSSGRFMAGAGTIVAANSPLRGMEFVTRKITNSAAKIKLGLQKELKLGNLEAKRDWGYAPEYVKAMWRMMQHHTPDDFVVATGETHSVKEFAEEAFAAVGLNWKDHVISEKNLHRPMEVHQLCGDPRKAKEILGWEPKVTFHQLVKIMAESDLRLWKLHLNGRSFPWDAPSFPQGMDVIARNVTRDAARSVAASNPKLLKKKSVLGKIFG